MDPTTDDRRLVDAPTPYALRTDAPMHRAPTRIATRAVRSVSEQWSDRASARLLSALLLLCPLFQSGQVDRSEVRGQGSGVRGQGSGESGRLAYCCTAAAGDRTHTLLAPALHAHARMPRASSQLFGFWLRGSYGLWANILYHRCLLCMVVPMVDSKNRIF